LAQYHVDEFQTALAEFLNTILAEQDDFIVAAIDGKTACQTCDDEGRPIHMLNGFVHDVRVNLIQYSVHGDKTNEPGCLNTHAEELFAHDPLIRLLTGDAIFAQRPLIEVLRNHGCDYLFQVRDNQHDTLEALTFQFKDAETTEELATEIYKTFGRK